MQITGPRLVWAKPGSCHVACSCGSQPPPRRDVAQPGRGRKFVACANAANSARVTSNLPSAKGLAKITLCCGSSRPDSVVGTSYRWFSPGAAPIWELPAGGPTHLARLGQPPKAFGGGDAVAAGCGDGVGAGCGAGAGGCAVVVGGVGAGAGCGAAAGGITIGFAAAGACGVAAGAGDAGLADGAAAVGPGGV